MRELLDKIDNPSDLKKLDIKQLPQLCKELRGYIIEQLSANPGHLGSSLGVVELTVALHYVYDTPNDSLVWDVGHQAYSHKILTGRKEQFSTNRRYKGLSGFPKRSESCFDSFGGGHASVSVSAALGMDVADSLLEKKSHSIAIIGDGAMSGGLAFEGLNNAGFLSDDLLVILNDNDMSIDPNVGALNQYLVNITTSSKYNRFKNGSIALMSSLPRLNKFVAKILGGVKTMLMRNGNLFQSLGFRYFGTVDGHDVIGLVEILTRLKAIDKPKLLHIITKKGKGFAPAEDSQTTWHAPGKYDPVTGERVVNKAKFSRFQDVFGNTLLELAKENDKIVGVTPAMPSGCSMSIMQKELPNRVFDVGIAEGHAITFSAGMATRGLLPFCNIYSSFMQRAVDNIIHDAVLQDIDLVLCLDRSGLVGEDGVTHHGVYDIALLRSIPNIKITAPSNEHQLRNLMFTASHGGLGTFVIRYPRGCGNIENWHNEMSKIEIGKSVKLKSGKDLAILSLGTTTFDATAAIEQFESENSNISIEHIDLLFAKPLDYVMLEDVASRFTRIITVEDGSISGGVGSAIIEWLSDHNHHLTVKRLGVKDCFIQHGKVEELKKEAGFDTSAIYQTIKDLTEL